MFLLVSRIPVRSEQLFPALRESLRSGGTLGAFLQAAQAQGRAIPHRASAPARLALCWVHSSLSLFLLYWLQNYRHSLMRAEQRQIIASLHLVATFLLAQPWARCCLMMCLCSAGTFSAELPHVQSVMHGAGVRPSCRAAVILVKFKKGT